MQSLANKTQSDYFFANGIAGLGISSLGPQIPWTPKEITTALWFDAADETTITIDTGVSQWNDKSGNNRNATQATGANQPLVISNALNGKNVVRFDGSNDTLNYSGTFFANSSYTIHAVVTRRDGKNNNYLMGGTTSSTNQNLLFGWHNSTTFRYAQYANDIDASVEGYTTPITDLWGVGLNTSVGRFIYRNGTLANSNTTTTALSSYNGALLGAFLATSTYYNGDIAEIIATRSVLSTEDRQKIEGYLAWKWGLVANLPADHPYKNSAPTAPAPLPTSASHISDVVTGSDWQTAGYGTAGYILPNSDGNASSTIQLLPDWLKNYSNTFSYFFSDTNLSPRPYKPNTTITNDFGISIFGTPQFIDFDIKPSETPRYISLYMIPDPSAPPGGLELWTRVVDKRYNTELVPTRIYANTIGGPGIQTNGGLMAKFQVTGNIRVWLSGNGWFNVGLLHGIFFD